MADTVYSYVAAVALILCVFFAGASLFSDASNAGGYANQPGFQTFNKTNQYGSLFTNQTNDMVTSLRQQQAAGENNALSSVTLINVFIQGGSLAATGLFAMFDIGATIISDFGVTLGIPGFFVAMAIMLLFFKAATWVMRMIRLGY